MANFFGTITNSVSGNAYRDHATFTETYDLVNGTTTVSGQSYRYIVKGQGQVFAEVGTTSPSTRPARSSTRVVRTTTSTTPTC